MVKAQAIGDLLFGKFAVRRILVAPSKLSSLVFGFFNDHARMHLQLTAIRGPPNGTNTLGDWNFFDLFDLLKLHLSVVLGRKSTNKVIIVGQ